MKQISLLLLFFLTTILRDCAPATRHFREIPDQNLNYISLYRAHADYGYSVVYNPDYCQQIGEACEFFLSHAYAHEVYYDTPLPPNVYPKLLEDRADCWAARYVKPESVLAAYNVLTNGSGNVPITGDPTSRAENIKACAIKYSNWVG